MENIITVIVPVYKVEDYLDRCVKSIVSQTYKNLDIILVDDGSPDGSPQICDSWAEKDSRIRVIHKANGGVSSARNAGLNAATGKYVGFVDGDDCVLPDMFKKLISAVQNDGTRLAACGYTLAENKFIPSEDKVISAAQALEDMFNIKEHPEFEGFVWNKLYLLDDVKKYGVQFSEELSMCEDTLFNFKYLSHISDVSLVKLCGYDYTYRQDSVMRLKPVENDFKMIGLIDYFLENTAESRTKDYVVRWAYKYWVKAADDYIVYKKGREFSLKAIDRIKKYKSFILNDFYFTRVEKLFAVLLCNFKLIYKTYKKFKYFG